MPNIKHNKRITRIYSNKNIRINHLIIIEDASFRHLISALRYTLGDKFIIFNGNGREYLAIIESLSRKQLSARVSQLLREEHAPPLHIQLAIGISKGDRMDWVIQKATEMGVSEIMPLITEHTDLKHKPPLLEKKWQHWHKIMLSACEQSSRCHIVNIHKAMSLNNWLDQREQHTGLFFDHRAATTLIQQAQPNSSNIDIIIGPEGGLSQHERDRLNTEGIIASRMGPRVLRTETAPIAAIAIIQSLWGDWQ